MNGYLDPYQPIDKHVHTLPHWQQEGSTIYLTWRLGDALPHELVAKWKADRDDWIRRHPKPWSENLERQFHQRFSQKIDFWLDQGSGSCFLREPRCSSVVAEAIIREHGFRGQAHVFVVMPNHVHLIFTLDERSRLEALMKSIKGRSSRKLNLVRGTKGENWQPGYWDRIIRGPEHFDKCRKYILENPAKARLKKGSFVLWENNIG